MPDLYPFQVDGARWLHSRQRALLADQMGLGKTPQVIVGLGLERRKKVLVVCPAIARLHWQKEFETWDLLGHDHTVISYDEARNNLGLYTVEEWDHLVLDECHFAKNMAAARTKAVLGKNGIGWHARSIWALSGTPVPNHYGELYPLLKTFGVWGGSYKDFVTSYCEFNELGDIKGSTRDKAARAELRGILKGIMLRRMKKQVMPDMPPLRVDPYYVEPDPKYIEDVLPVGGSGRDLQQRSRVLGRELAESLRNLSGRGLDEYLAERFDHFAPWRRVNALLKVPAVFETIRFEIRNHLCPKFVVYGWHREPLELLRDLLKAEGIWTKLVWGGTPDKKKQSAADQFNKRIVGVFIGQIGAAGTAISLDSAHEGFLIEKDWVPGNNAQALERMHRITQKRAVRVRDVILADGIDDVLHYVNKRKMRDISELLD